MVERRLVLSAVALLLALPFAADAQRPVTPQAFVESIYQPYRQKGFKGQPYEQTARFFAPDLAHAIDADLAQSKQKGQPPALNGDPFVGGQEWDVSGLSISSAVAGNWASVAVEFMNMGAPKVLTLTLVPTPQGWRIHDVSGADGSLRALYKLRRSTEP